MLIKIIVTIFCLLALVNAFGRFRRRQLRLWLLLLWSALWLGIVAAVYWPGNTDYAARLFGVGRGLDLFVFLSILAIFYSMYRVYVKVDKVERKITELVREDALRQVLSERE